VPILAEKSFRLKFMSVSVDYPFVLFRLREQRFGLSSIYVREIVSMPGCTPIPGSTADVRGVINLRGAAIPLLDLRMHLGLPSAQVEIAELVELLRAREQDHINWLQALEQSVAERTEFKLARDPHKCAFGQWYDNFTTDDRALQSLLRRFDAPHKKIHAIADEVTALMQEEQFDAAQAIIERTRGQELAELRRLFAEAIKLFTDEHRELAMVIEDGAQTIALCIDAVDGVERFSADNVKDPPELFGELQQHHAANLAQNDEGQIIVILDAEKLMAKAPELQVA